MGPYGMILVLVYEVTEAVQNEVSGSMFFQSHSLLNTELIKLLLIFWQFALNISIPIPEPQ